MSDPVGLLGTLIARCNSYLGHGGFFNPEMMDHQKVGTLLLDVRDFLAALPPIAPQLMPLIERWRKQANERGYDQWTMNYCADELEAALATLPQQVDSDVPECCEGCGVTLEDERCVTDDDVHLCGLCYASVPAIPRLAALPPAPPQAQERWKECARCQTKYPQETKGLSPCCDASLINVVDDVAASPPAQAQAEHDAGELAMCEFCEYEFGEDGRSRLVVCNECWNRANKGTGWMQRALEAEKKLAALPHEEPWEAHYYEVRRQRDDLKQHLNEALELLHSPEKWMKWCDARLLERCEQLESKLAALPHEEPPDSLREETKKT